MKGKKQYIKAFRLDEEGFIAFPPKISSVKISRILNGEAMGCSYCFPHGYETANSTIINRQRNWKKFRRTKWKGEKLLTSKANCSV